MTDRCRQVLRWLAFGGWAVLLGTTAWAAGEIREPGRFDALVRHAEGGVVATAPRKVESLDPADPLRVGWSEFRSRHGGRWDVYIDERTTMPTLVSGAGLPLVPDNQPSPVDLDQLESRLRALLDTERTLLGAGGPSLELDRQASVELRPGHWQVLFRQVVDGVRVENSRLEFHVVDGRVVMFGATNWVQPALSGTPKFDGSDARDALRAFVGAELDGLEAEGEAELVVLALDRDPDPERPRRWTGARGRGLTHALVWRLRYTAPGEPSVWVGEVDAHDGSIRAFYDGAHYAAIQGAVLPASPNGDCAAGGCELDDYPMPFADFREGSVAKRFGDPYGNLTCTDSSSTVETRLQGKYVSVEDGCGELRASATCGQGVHFGVSPGNDCNVAEGASPGNTRAARSGYYHINRAAEVARLYNPGNAWLNGPMLKLASNYDRVCNASWGTGKVWVYRSGVAESGVTCANAGEIAGVVIHEWGHGYDENDGGGYDTTSEAYGDVASIFATHESCFGVGMRTDGSKCTGYGDTCLTCDGFRDLDWATRRANTPATPQVFVTNNCGPGPGPCGRSVHCESYPISEAMWDFVNRDLPASGVDRDTAWIIAERLWHVTRQGSGGPIYTCALPQSDSCAASSWYQRMRVADDDDGDLTNGTPHAAALYAAFARHNIACGSPTDPANRSTSSCRALPAPTVALAADQTGVTLSWAQISGAAAYVVSRGEMGCDRQLVPQATLSAGQTRWTDTSPDPGLSRQYRVQAVEANPACRGSVSNCTTTSSGPRLQKNGHRFVEIGSRVNHNGLLDPGETVQLPVTLFNGGAADADGVTARLRTAIPTQGRVVVPVASYPDLASGEQSEPSSAPFEVTLFESGISCGESLELELAMDAANAPTRTTSFAIPLGVLDRDYVQADAIAIPSLTSAPVVSSFNVMEDKTIAELDVSVAITHYKVSELIVELISPHGTTVRLHDNSGSGGDLYVRYDLDASPDGPGSLEDFVGERTAGQWKLSVRDTILGAFTKGTIQGFTLHVTSVEGFDCEPLRCTEPPPAASPTGLVASRVTDGGDGVADLTLGWNAVSGSAGYDVLQSPDPSFATAVDLTDRTSGATTLTVEDGAAVARPGDPRLTFYRVRATNACGYESP